MDQKVLNIILLVIAFLVGLGLGAFVLPQGGIAPSGQSSVEKNLAGTINALGSKLAPPMIAGGRVEEINGRAVTLARLDNKLTINVADSAKVYAIPSSTGSNSQPDPKETSFSEIKKNSDVDIELKLMPDGSLQGTLVYIYPEAAPSK